MNRRNRAGLMVYRVLELAVGEPRAQRQEEVPLAPETIVSGQTTEKEDQPQREMPTVMWLVVITALGAMFATYLMNVIAKDHVFSNFFYLISHW